MISLLKRIVPFQYRPAFLFKEIIHSPYVKSGPFKGMYYDANGVYSAKFPKIAGTYEKEISFYFEKDHLDKFDCFIDVGAAEGYYAIGVARNNPQLKVVTFESEIINRIWQDHLSVKNKTSNSINQKQHCSSETLVSEIKNWQKPFLLIDVEGGEYELLNDLVIAAFKHCTLLVEIHEFIYPYMENVIKSRFRKSHNSETITEVKRIIEDLPIQLDQLQKILFKRASKEILDEQRPVIMKWLYLTPKDDL